MLLEVAHHRVDDDETRADLPNEDRQGGRVLRERGEPLLFAPARSGGRARISAALLEPFTRTAGPGEVLFREGEAGAEMYYVLEGAVALAKGGQELRTMGPGEFFGEMSMLIQTERTAGAAAGPDGARLVAITRDNFDMILRENPGIVLAILREMAARLKTTSAALSAARGA